MTDSRSRAQQTPGASVDDIEPAERLASLWKDGERVDCEEFLRSTPATPAQLSEVLQLDQGCRWEQGERIPAENYLERFTQLRDDAEGALDLIFHEFLIRERLGERPQQQEFVDRFPRYSRALNAQIALHLALDGGDSRIGAAVTTAPFASKGTPPDDRLADGQVRFLAHGRLSTNHEVQALLRQRLRLLSLIAFGAFILYLPVLWEFLAGSWGAVPYVIMVAQTGAMAVLLSPHRALSLRALRWIEASLFACVMIFCVWKTTECFRAISLAKFAALHASGPIMAARNVSWTWASMIVVYGIWIPNTTRRAIVAVAVMVVGFLIVSFWLTLTDASVSVEAVTGFLLFATTDVLFAAAIAIFGAYRIQTLQRAASEARKLGPYRLVKRLGAGGMGKVYLAEHALLRRPCALKVIRQEHVGDLRLLSRFEREVQAMAALTHPNTVKIYDYGLADDGTFYYAMEYVPGWSLEEIVRREGPVPPARVVFLLRQVCSALSEAHNIGLVHRDVKPGNILICASGGIHDWVKLVDFGLVRLLPSRAPPGNALTELGTSAGTPAFMSPEQAAGETDVDARTDIYSLGAVAYFLLTGHPPFVEPTSVQTLAAHLTCKVIPPSNLQSRIPADLERVVLCCLEKRPQDRFANAASLELALAKSSCAANWSKETAAEWWRDHHCDDGQFSLTR